MSGQSRLSLALSALTIAFLPLAAAAQPGPSETTRRAVALYKSEDFHAASIEFFKVANRQVTTSQLEIERAEFFLAKTFFQLELYAPSLAFLQRIVAAGNSHRYHAATLKWRLSAALAADERYIERVAVERLFRGTKLAEHSAALWPLLFTLACTDAGSDVLEAVGSDLARLQEIEDNAERYEALIRSRSNLTRQLFEVEVADALTAVVLLAQQLAILERADPSWQTTRVASDALQEISLHKALAEVDAGKLAENVAVKIAARVAVVGENKGAWAQIDRSRCSAKETALPVRGPAAAPVLAPRPRPKSGCAGCASGGSSGATALVLVLVVLFLGSAGRLRQSAARAGSASATG